MTTDEKQEVDFLLKEREMVAEQWRSVWQTYGVSLVLAFTGIWTSFLLIYQYFEKAEVLFVIMPFLIIGWFATCYLQAAELGSRDRYISVLEEKIRKLSGLNFPCWESGFRPIIYGNFRFQVLVFIVAIPIAILFFISIFEGYYFLHNKCASSTIAPIFVLACVLVSGYLVYFIWYCETKKRKKLEDFQKDISMKKIKEVKMIKPIN